MRKPRAQRKAIEKQLAEAGFPAAREQAREMVEAAQGDAAVLQCWVTRRQGGEPLEWLVGFTNFMGYRVRVDRGVYVPRPQTELIARRAIELLPPRGTAVDLCTGSGAIAVALENACPDVRVVASDIDANACRCAANNGVEVYQGHLADPIPTELTGNTDVVVGVVPYVPTDKIVYLPRDVRQHEPLTALDGGDRGISVLKQAIVHSARLLHAGGALVLELGGNQDDLLAPAFDAAGFDLVERLLDDEGDLRGIHAQLASEGRP